MEQRPELTVKLDSQTFRNYYYLKEELVSFCKKVGLQSTDGKIELTNRIANYLDTGEKQVQKKTTRRVVSTRKIHIDDVIEENFICSETHRAFFKEQIGSSFSFSVGFQKWLKSNSGKTYKDAIQAYYQILEEKKKTKTTIDKQFEYNTYIRDFFQDNQGKTLKDAITCWNYKKSIKGHNKYEPSDIKVLDKLS